MSSSGVRTVARSSVTLSHRSQVLVTGHRSQVLVTGLSHRSCVTLTQSADNPEPVHFVAGDTIVQVPVPTMQATEDVHVLAGETVSALESLVLMSGAHISSTVLTSADHISSTVLA